MFHLAYDSYSHLATATKGGIPNTGFIADHDRELSLSHSLR